MASAGRVLLLPKGDWNSSSTFSMLDMVRHNGSTWVAKKQSVSIEPNESNGEFWQQMSDFSLFDEKKQDRHTTIITIKSGESYKQTFGFGESCLLYAYITTMEYACIFACCGVNEWAYNITKLSESTYQTECFASIGSVSGEDLNTITFKNEADTDRALILIKLPFYP